MVRVFKENPIFFSVTGVLLVVSLAFSAMYMLGSLSNSGFVDQFDREQKELSRLKKNEPHPTKPNLSASEQNVRELEDAKADHENTLRAEGKLQLIAEGTTRYEFTVKSRIREYALAKRRLARTNGVRLKKGEEEEAFGFSNYVGETTTTNNDVLAREIDKQRAILDFLVDELLQSTSGQTPDIIELVAVRRENLEKLIDSSQSIAPDDVFQLDPKISARVEGAIDSYAFQFEFVGYTSGLRNLFNKLADFKLPVVVRDVNVKRAQLQSLASTSPAHVVVPGGSPFGAPFGTKSESPSNMQQKPVVDKNLSHFTITLEFIELAQPVVEIEEGS